MLVDANILLYAEGAASPIHEAARLWWDEQLSGSEGVCLSWPVLTAFIRIGTNRRDFSTRLTVEEAVANLVSDAHLAALATEYGCLLYTTDSDFSRFPGLKWRNPLK